MKIHNLNNLKTSLFYKGQAFRRKVQRQTNQHLLTDHQKGRPVHWRNRRKLHYQQGRSTSSGSVTGDHILKNVPK